MNWCKVTLSLIFLLQLKLFWREILPKEKVKNNLLIGLLKLFLFRKVAVHIFENPAFRNPFIPAVNKTAQQCQWIDQRLHTNTSRRSCSLFVPSAVMNEVFNLLLLYVDLYTLQIKEKHTGWRPLSVNKGTKKTHRALTETNLCLIEQWPMKAQDSLTCRDKIKGRHKQNKKTQINRLLKWAQNVCNVIRGASMKVASLILDWECVLFQALYCLALTAGWMKVLPRA